MTTPCRILAAAAAVVALRAGAGGAETNAPPATAGAAFAAVRDEVLAAPSGALARDGFVFCVGRACSDADRGTSVGEAKARLAAAERLSVFVRDTSPWPEGTPDEDRAPAWALLLAEAPLSIPEASAETILSDRPGDDLFLAVVAFPEKDVLAARPDAAALAAALDRLRALREAVVPPAADAPAAPALLEWIEPRGLIETNGAILNETCSESLL